MNYDALAIAVDIGQKRDLVANVRQDFIVLPVAQFPPAD